MVSAIVLVNSENEESKLVLEEIKNIPGVKEAYHVYGAFDIILRIEKESLDSLNEAVNVDIRTIKQIRSTLSLLIVN